MTLEQVKEHFKNAKEVKCAYSGKLCVLKDDFEVKYSCADDGSILTSDSETEMLVPFLYNVDNSYNGKLAEITKYKTNDVTVSEQLVKGYHKDACSEFKKRIEKDFPKFFEKKALEVGKWYFNNETSDYLVCFQTEESSYGFFDGEYSNSWTFIISDKPNTRLATDQEVKDALIQEAQKRYNVGDVVKCLSTGKDKELVDLVYFNNLSNSTDELWSDRAEPENARIFYNGKWATIVEETYKLGDRFKCDAGGEYILARTGSNNINLINLEDGNQWSNPLSVKNDCNIKPQEFNELCKGREFNKIS